jgi:hypothetical protein
MAIKDIKTPTFFLINDHWEAVQGGQDLKTFIEGFAKRIKNYKGSYITGQSVINPEFCNDFKKENLIKNSK